MDKSYLLAFGVVGMYRNVGLEIAVILISFSDCIILLRVSNQTLLVGNIARLKIYSIIKINLDAMILFT